MYFYSLIKIKLKVEQQHQVKLCKGSAGGTMASYRCIPVSPNEAKFRQLSPFIPACPTSSNFPHWAIKISYDSNSMLSNAIDPNFEDEV